MFKSYLKLAFRNLYKNKLYSMINIVGLSVAIACCIVAYVNYQFSQSFDRMHENATQIYRVNSFKIFNHKRQDWGIVPMPLAPALKKDIPGVEKMARIYRGSGTVKYGDKVFNEVYHFADPDFFDMFTYPVKYGDKHAFANWNGLVISEEIARKYFGDENPVGKQLIVSPDGEREFPFLVGMVIETPPKNMSAPLSILLPMVKIAEMYDVDVEDWKDWAQTAFVQIAAHASPEDVEKQSQSYLEITNDRNPDWQVQGFYLDGLPDLAKHAHDLRANILRPGLHPAAIIGPSVTAVLILLLACFNYVNTAIASASRRLKEIGIRKVMGGVKAQLVLQFLGENFVLCFIALLAGVGLAEIFVPFYDRLWPEISLSMNYSENLELLLFLIALLFFTAVAAGAYPAFYISGFNPVRIFRGKQKLGGTNPMIRILLTFQFALAMTTIICGLIFSQNADFIRHFDMGFDRGQLIVVPVKGEKNYKVFKNAIQNHPDILQVAGSKNLLASSWYSVEVKFAETKSQAALFLMGENYFDTMGLHLLEGRRLDTNLKTDVEEAILVNETLVREYGWQSPLEQHLTLTLNDEEKEYRVVGVVEDYYYNGVWGKIQPAIMKLAPSKEYRYLTVKLGSENLSAMASYLQDEWKRLFPNLPYDGFFQDEVMAEAIRVTKTISTIFFYVAILAGLIAAMGLFALVSLNIAKRTKEIGIRKVLGASILRIGQLISKEFIILLSIASIIAAVMGYFMVNTFIQSIYAYYVDFSLSPFVFSALMVFAVALLTVSSQVFRVATANPVEAIRDE